MRSVTITVPMCPPSILLPNRKRNTHWGAISKATYELRQVAKLAALGDRPHHWKPITGPCILSLHVAYARRRRIPDLDGSAAAAKAVIDGMADAGIIQDDRQFVELRVTHSKDPTGAGYVELHIEET